MYLTYNSYFLKFQIHKKKIIYLFVIKQIIYFNWRHVVVHTIQIIFFIHLGINFFFASFAHHIKVSQAVKM